MKSEQNFNNKIQKKNGSLLILILILITIAGVALFIPAISVLSISNRKNPSEVYFSKSAAKNGFVISYTHSVNKGRVHDYYEQTPENELILDRTVFVSYGAGIPEPEETPGAQFTVLENGYEINNLQRKVPRLVMAVGLIANHSITTTAEINFEKTKGYYSPLELFLTDYFAPQTSLILEIKRISLIKYILSTKMNS